MEQARLVTGTGWIAGSLFLKTAIVFVFLQTELTAASGRAAETHRGVLAGQDSATW